jgi:hypothetical protein
MRSVPKELLLVLALACGADAWASQSGALLPRPAVHTYSPDKLIEVLDALDTRGEDLRSVVAQLRVVMHDVKRGRDINLTGAYLGDRDGNLRLRLQYGESTVLDLAIRGGDATLWLPRKQRCYKGKRADILASSEAELALVALAGNAHDLFFPHAWSDAAIDRTSRVERERDVVNLYEVQGERRVFARRVWLNPAQPVVDKQEVLGPSGKLLGTVRYEDYRFPAGRAAAPDAPKYAYPARVCLANADGGRGLDLEIEELFVNTELTPARFDIRLPEGQAVEDMGAVLRSGRKLWE